jgi:ATP/maltotriose-dependent transcriptional regulator MalT
MYAARCGDETAANQYEAQIGIGYVFGPATVEEGIAWHQNVRLMHSFASHQLGIQAMLEAMQGRFAVARTMVADFQARREELGPHVTNAHRGEWIFHIELRAGELQLAEAALRQTCDELDRMGEKGWLSTQAGQLGHVLCTLGQHEEAEEWARKSAELGQSDDITTQMYWRQVQARVSAYRGEFERAEVLAREAVRYGEQTDMLFMHGLSRLDLAEVLELAGRNGDAAQEVRRALELYERKGDLPMADQARARLERLL